ncbi:MAG: dicarboxylate/amino acid:cation symporter [Leptospiraceae bacterium]|nr:dicarboxylate/amino acid:cation symporter [Leptospiraceae bacterium]
MQAKAAHIWIPVGIIVGMLLALLLGWFFGTDVGMFGWLGTLFLNALKMIIVPLIMSSMVLGIVRLGDIRTVGMTGFKSVAYYTVTTGLAVLVGLILVNIIQPGVADPSETPVIITEAPGNNTADIPSDGADSMNQDGTVSHPKLTVTDIVLSMVPENIIAAMADLQILPLIVFSMLLGGVLSTMGERARPLVDLFDSLEGAVIKIVDLVIWLSPLGVFGLVCGRLAEAGGLAEFVNGDLYQLRWYALAVIIGLAVHALVVLPGILILLARRNPITYFWNMMTALVTAFSTSSSSATLPVTMECVEENNQVSPRSARFVLPLGATINMDGTALYEAVAALFIAQMYGIDLSTGQQLIIFLTATLAAVGAAGIPQAGLVTMVMVLQAVDLPVEGITLILAIDWFLDRCRTTVNVWGDAIGAAVIANTREIQAADQAAAENPS